MQIHHSPRSRPLLALACSLLVALTALVPLGAAQAAPGDVGYQGFKYGAGAGSGWVDPDASPTASKPQSKLWHAQDRWWGVMIDPASNDFYIHSLDATTQRWTSTGTLVDTRNGSRADALWDGDKLFIASHLGSGSSASSGVQISRYSFTGGRYVRDSGFPVTISSGGVEAAVIAKDSTGRLWATFTQSNRVRVAVSQPGGQSWGAPFSPAVAGVNVDRDDISTLTTYDGQLSVVWSNQTDDSIYAATHRDGDPTTTWQVARRVISGPNEADDHLNLASVEGNAAGKLFVAVKTGQDDVSNNASAPLIRLLVLGTDDVWRQYIHSRVRDGLTRPIVLLDGQVLRVFAAGPNTGGVIYMKETPMGNISFGDGRGQPFIALASDKNLNNPTSTKQNLSASTGLVVLASDQVTGRYAHNTMSLGSAPPPPPPAGPVAAFSATPTSGQAPLAVSFSDQSTGSPDSWSWSFGDGGSATTRNPSHTYTAAGTYTVSLTVANANGTDTETRTGLITVGEDSPPPPGPGGYQAAVTGDNPVGYWRLGGTGTTAAAVVGADGTVNGGVTAIAGALSGDTDGARSFNGSTGYISVPSSPALNTTGDFTIEAWVRPSVVHGGVVVQKGGANGYSVWQYRLGMTSGGQWRGTVFVGSQALAVTAPGQAALNTWTHLVLTRDAGTLRMYVNGSLASSTAAAGVLNSTGSIFAIGRSGASATSYFNGGIDEVAFYGQPLSAGAVAAHYAAGRG